MSNYDYQGNIGQLKITKIHEQWYTEWENKDGEPIEIFNDTILNIIHQLRYFRHGSVE